MSRFPYHRRYHEDALEGMQELTLEQCGAYNRILDLIYARGGSIKDDDVFLAGVMRCSTRKWRTLRTQLLDLGKIELEDGHLTNARCKLELEYLAKFSRTQAERRTKKSGQRPNPLKNNGTEQTAVPPTNTDTEKKESPPHPPKGGGGGRSKIDLSWLRDRIAETLARIECNRTTAGFANWAPLLVLLDPPSGEPCDWMSDVVPAIEAAAASCSAAGDPLRAWTHPAIARVAIDNRNRRLSGLPAVTAPASRGASAKPATRELEIPDWMQRLAAGGAA